jgi:hypothetical protein
VIGHWYVGPNFSSGVRYVGPNFSSGVRYVGPNFSSGVSDRRPCDGNPA